ncbi:MAG: hypothetical protein R6U32_02705 [Candidatus Woesearchaeota archaeon]
MAGKDKGKRSKSERSKGKRVRKKKPQSTLSRVFGIEAKTKEQKRFVRWFVVLKSVVYLVIFVLAIMFLIKLKSLQ